MSDREYEMRERQEFHRQLKEVERAPLADRKEAAASFLEAMRDRPEIVAERVSWLLDGNYGYGAMQAAKQVAGNKRMNRLAWLTHVVGALEWQSPSRMSAASWKKLTHAQKQALDDALETEVSELRRTH